MVTVVGSVVPHAPAALALVDADTAGVDELAAAGVELLGVAEVPLLLLLDEHALKAVSAATRQATAAGLLAFRSMDPPVRARKRVQRGCDARMATTAVRALS